MAYGNPRSALALERAGRICTPAGQRAASEWPLRKGWCVGLKNSCEMGGFLQTLCQGTNSRWYQNKTDACNFLCSLMKTAEFLSVALKEWLLRHKIKYTGLKKNSHTKVLYLPRLRDPKIEGQSRFWCLWEFNLGQKWYFSSVWKRKCI